MSIRARSAAIKLIGEYAITLPNEIPIEDIIIGQGVLFEEKSMNGADGRIMFSKKNAIIVINSNIKDKNRRRFVIAHELGHFELHKNLERFYVCDEKSFMDFHQKGSQEAEANNFAAELLMPTKIFQSLLKREPFSVQSIIELSCIFTTSITSTAIKYTQYGNHPIAVFFAQNGIIKWCAKSDDFICEYNRSKGEPLHNQSVAFDSLKTKKIADKPQIVMPYVWFKDFNISPTLYFWEQCVAIPSINAVLSFVWVSEEFSNIKYGEF